MEGMVDRLEIHQVVDMVRALGKYEAQVRNGSVTKSARMHNVIRNLSSTELCRG